MAIYEVVLQQNYASQQIINRWNYVSSGTPASVTGSFALTSALGAVYDAGAVPPAYPPTKLMRLLAAMQSTGVTFDLLSVKNLYSVTDFYEAPFVQALAGTQTGGEAMAPFIAIGFRTNRVRTDVRRATKRFVGLIETNVGVNGSLVAGFLTGPMAAVATAMAAVLTYDDEGNTITFNPAVCGKEKYTPDPDKPERVAYRYYSTEATQLSHTATGILWDSYPQVRSQVSRQFGRGR